MVSLILTRVISSVGAALTGQRSLVRIQYDSQYFALKRIHYFEIEDKDWLPNDIRDYMTDFLQFVANKMNLYDAIIPVLNESLAKNKTNTIIDLASGGGGGIESIYSNLSLSVPDLKIMLSDLYPNLSAWQLLKSKTNGAVDFIEKPLDCTMVPNDLQGLRTQFLSLHHFKPETVKQIFKNTIEAKQGIAIFESTERTVLAAILMFLAPIMVLLTTLFIKPFSWKRLILTYLIPIIPLLVFHDGFVSVLRSYHPEEMEAMAKAADENGLYNWKAGKIKNKGATITYITGNPI